MRTNSLSIDMDFRIIPSVIPLHSPSPDKKSLNVITPTISPNAIDIKKNATPTKIVRAEKERQKQNAKFIQDLQTELKYNSYNQTQHSQSGSDYMSALKQKDQIIRNLRNIIDMVTESTRYKKPNEEEELELKNEVKILTIENQKLVNIIEKMSKTRSSDQGNGKKKQQYEAKINELIKTIKQNESFHQQETKQLKRFNKNLNAQYRNLQNEKKELEMENKKLLKILKEKNEGQRMKLSDTSDQNISGEEKSMSVNKSQQRLTLMKIRQQHSENLKMLKEGLIKQIQQTFDTMRIALEGINSKITSLSRRLESIQKISWERVKRTHIQRQSITISIRQGEIQEGPQTDRSFKFERRNNSQIYIEQGPSSSHEKASRDQFARLEQIPSQKNLSSTVPLVEELNATKAQLHELRFKYQKLCLDTSSIAFSERAKSDQIAQVTERYEESLKLLEQKEKQINILYAQVRKIEEENLQNLALKQQQISNKDQQIKKLKETIQKQFKRHQDQTESKVDLLIQNYEKEVEILKKQIASLTISQQSRSLKEPTRAPSTSPSSSAIQSLQQQIILLQQKHEHQYKIISEALSQTEISLNEERIKKQDLQQRNLIFSSQINQLKIYIENLNHEIVSKNQQFESMKSLKDETQENLDKELENVRNYRNLLKDRENQISRMRKVLAESQTDSILQQITELQTFIQSQLKQNQSQSSVSSIQNKEQHTRTILLMQIQDLRDQLLKSQTLNTQQEARIYQLQNLYELTKEKLKKQQQAHRQLIGEFQKCEGVLVQYKSKKEKEWGNIESLRSNVLERLIGLRRMEQERVENGRRALQHGHESLNT